LYDLDFKGCISCFAWKRAGGKSYGHCAVKDDLKPIFQKIENADAILIGSPIYLGITTGVTRCFLEWLIYPYLVYDVDRSSLFEKKIKTVFIYTAGATDEIIQEMGFDRNVKGTEMTMERIFGSCESFFVTDTLQFDDFPGTSPPASIRRQRRNGTGSSSRWTGRRSNYPHRFTIRLIDGTRGLW
jgi:multimeric flavodoxin WrbA